MLAQQERPNGRAWCYEFRFPGKAPAMAGTVFVRLGATHQEVETACHAHWREIFPDNLHCPLVRLAPGMLVFMEES